MMTETQSSVFCMKQLCIRTALLTAALFAVGGGSVACWSESNVRAAGPDDPNAYEVTPGQVVDFPDKQLGSASSTFWDHWGDGKAEIATYTGQVDRYGEKRSAEVTLIYVTEPHDPDRWVKTSGSSDAKSQNVMKLNRVLKFQTGIYPYSVMTSVFSPVKKWDRPRFQPAKVTLTAQEWCGHVFHGLWPGVDEYLSIIHSYFGSEGDDRKMVDTDTTPLFEDGLWIQLRELDGQFNDGKDWSGRLVPALWQTRKGHSPPMPVDASIERTKTKFQGQSVTRFTLNYGEQTVIFDVAREYPHHIVHYKRNGGTELRLKKVERLAYWKMNASKDADQREKLGLDPTLYDGEPTDSPSSESSTPK